MHDADKTERMRSLSIIIPCCNEEEALPALAGSLEPAIKPLLSGFAIEVIFVDDGSTDDTWDRLVTLRESCRLWKTVLARHKRNLGLGAALQTGFAQATGEVIVTVDADGTYPFSIITSLIDALDSGADVATASPYHRLGHVEDVSPVRLFFSRGASLLYRVVVDRRIATYTAMVRAYRAPTLAASISDDPGFLHVAMTLVESIRRGAIVAEVPATLSRRQVGRSKARLAKTSAEHAGYLLNLTKLRATFRFWQPGLKPSQSSPRHEAVKHG